MLLTINNDQIRAEISTLNGEIVSVKNNYGHEYFWSGNEWKYHAPVLFPICGRVKDFKYTYKGKEYELKQHGFTRGSEFAVESHNGDTIILTLSENEETLKVYPFHFLLTLKYRIVDNSLVCEFSVKNTSREPLPFMIGWHPAFLLEGSSPLSSFKVDFGKNADLKIRPLTPTNFIERYTLPFATDNGKYRLNTEDIINYRTLTFENTKGYARIFSDSEPHSVTLTWSNNVPYFSIWKIPEEEVRFICLEPWSGLPSDGTEAEDFETKPDMIKLSPGSVEVFNFSATFN